MCGWICNLYLHVWRSDFGICSYHFYPSGSIFYFLIDLILKINKFIAKGPG